MRHTLKILFFIIPFCGFGQTCITLDSNSQNAVQYVDSVEYCVDSVSCYGSCDGRIVINVYPPGVYRYNWDSIPQLGENIKDSICAGTPGVTITDTNNNFIVYIDIPVYEPSPINNFATITDPTCFGDVDGSINVTTNGGTLPFSYNWSTGNTATGLNTTLNNISSGQYVLVTIDDNLCYDTISYTLDDPEKINSTTITDTLSCIGSCDGTGSVIPSNGIEPYYYLWNDSLAQTTATANGLCYGIHTVYITDSMGCLDTNEVFIQNPDTLKLSNITIDSACYQICDGKISVSIEGGTSPYNVSWSLNDSVFNILDTIIDSLCPNMYKLTFTDLNGCMATEDINLVERSSFSLVANSPIPDSCYNSCTGQVTAHLLYQYLHNPPFIYNWSNGTIDSVASNLCSDSISLELIDNRGCRDTFYYFVDEPDSLSFDAIDVIHNFCHGDSNGTITVINLTGGINPITYSWNNISSAGTPGISYLPSGFYDLHIEDANGCSIDVANIEVTQPPILNVSYIPSDVSCSGYADGSISINVSGGITPYKVNGISLLSNDTIVSNLSAGEYLYTIIDSNNNCFYSEDTITLAEPDQLLISDSVINVLCHGDLTGSIDLTITGGNPAYSYIWSTSDTTADLVNIVAGTYNVLVTDTKGCTENGIYMITEPQFPITSDIIGTNVLCNGENTGFANLTVNGGTYPYSYLWSNADTTEDINNLIAGIYSVTIIDANNCTDTISETITEPSLISSLINIDSVACYGDSTGVINIINTIGGTSPYTYSFSNGLTYTSPTNIIVTAGQYNLNVIDINSCDETLSLNVYEPSELISSLSNTNITCYEYNDGFVNLTPFGGVGNYIFNWSNNESTEDIYNLSAGDYIIELTDGNGCIVYDTSTITEPLELLIASSVENSVCNGDDLGSIDVTSSGGTGGHSFLWSEGSTSEDLINIVAGNYFLEVTDANNCTTNESFIITEPLAYLPYFNVNNVMCFGDLTGSVNFSISGNTSPYTFTWSNGANTQDIEYLAAGTYSVTVQDANNCTELFDVTLTEPEELILEMWSSNATCEENNDGSITTNVAGGTMPYAYFWSNGLYDSDLYNLSKGFYTLEIRDANSCIYPTQTIEVGFEGYDGCIEIPSGFTPNNDGIHDEWAIYGLYNFPDVVVSVYNRWGQKVFFSERYNVPWDGKNGGVDLPIATYYYVIELKDSGKVFNGTVTIKR